jgi:hypothetical protein
MPLVLRFDDTIEPTGCLRWIWLLLSYLLLILEGVLGRTMPSQAEPFRENMTKKQAVPVASRLSRALNPG